MHQSYCILSERIQQLVCALDTIHTLFNFKVAKGRMRVKRFVSSTINMEGFCLVYFDLKSSIPLALTEEDFSTTYYQKWPGLPRQLKIHLFQYFLYLVHIFGWDFERERQQLQTEVFQILSCAQMQCLLAFCQTKSN